MMDREVEAISDFLQHFGSLGCRQICVRRTEPKARTPEDVGHFVLETLATWRAEGLDAERVYKVATIAIQFDAYKLPGTMCMPACCRPWGRWTPPARQGRVAPSRARSSNRRCSARSRLGPRRRRTRRFPTTWRRT
jgi:hypothetical protein